MGHGSELKEYKKVPKGCVLVVPTKSGETVVQRTFSSNQLKFLDSANRTTILDPTHHKAELFKLFGPVSIFTEGDLYPEFYYSLFNYHPSRSYVNPRTGLQKQTTASAFLSGIVMLEGETPADPLLIESIRHMSSGHEEFKKTPKPGTVIPRRFHEQLLTTPLFIADEPVNRLSLKGRPEGSQEMNTSERKRLYKDIVTRLNPEAANSIRKLRLPELFKFSSIPTADSVDERIKEDLEDCSVERPRPVSISTTVGDYIQEILPEENMTSSQEEVFEMGGPGVYYNFVCRSMNLNSEPTPFKLPTAAMHGIYEAESRRKTVVRNAYLTRKTSSKRKTSSSKKQTSKRKTSSIKRTSKRKTSSSRRSGAKTNRRKSSRN